MKKQNLFVCNASEKMMKNLNLFFVIPYGLSKILDCELISIDNLNNIDPNEYDKIFTYALADTCFGGVLDGRRVKLAIFFTQNKKSQHYKVLYLFR